MTRRQRLTGLAALGMALAGGAAPESAGYASLDVMAVPWRDPEISPAIHVYCGIR